MRATLLLIPFLFVACGGEQKPTPHPKAEEPRAEEPKPAEPSTPEPGALPKVVYYTLTPG